VSSLSAARLFVLPVDAEQLGTALDAVFEIGEQPIV
jgi:hypothetical protein